MSVDPQSRSEHRRTSRATPLILAILSLALVACGPSTNQTTSPTHDGPNPAFVPNPVRKLLGDKIDIPLWHDRQRMRAALCGGTPCNARYATQEVRALATAGADLFTLRDFATQPQVVAVVQVPAGTNLPDLGLVGGAELEYHLVTLSVDTNGTYNTSDDHWTAFINRPNNTRSQLKVTRIEYPSSDIVPGAAQFDWDSVASRQLLGVRCGSGWCEMARDTPHPSPTPCEQATSSPTCRIKGYYDEQRLANPPAPAPGTTVNVPRLSTTFGRIIPYPAIAGYDESAFDAGFVPVAAVGVRGSPYKKALATLEPGVAYTLRIWHHPSGVGDSAVWGIGRLTWLVPGEKLLRSSRDLPIFRVNHANLVVPGNARWRWREEDEGFWVRCGTGCCEVRMG